MDTKTRRAVICGRSLISLLIENRLGDLGTMNVVRFDPHLPNVLERIAGLEPDVVVIEQKEGQGDLALAVLGMGIPVIELDSENRHATALNGRRFPADSLNDLAQMIRHITRAKAEDDLSRGDSKR